MTALFLASFLRDVRKLRDNRTQQQVARTIEQVERAGDVEDISQFKWLVGHPSYGRIRVGDWRLGVVVEGHQVTFVRCLHRRDVYRYFP